MTTFLSSIAQSLLWAAQREDAHEVAELLYDLSDDDEIELFHGTVKKGNGYFTFSEKQALKDLKTAFRNEMRRIFIAIELLDDQSAKVEAIAELTEFELRYLQPWGLND